MIVLYSVLQRHTKYGAKVPADLAAVVVQSSKRLLKTPKLKYTKIV